MLKTISIESSRREMAQRDSVELCGDTEHQVPTHPPHPQCRHPQPTDHIPLGLT